MKVRFSFLLMIASMMLTLFFLTACDGKTSSAATSKPAAETSSEVQKTVSIPSEATSPSSAPASSDSSAAKKNGAASDADAAASGHASASVEEGSADSKAKGKTLVVYYSWSGNTRNVAQIIQKATGADIFEIVPAEPYSTSYKEVVARAKEDLTSGARPKLRDAAPDLAPYDTIFLGSPNWWSTLATPVMTFLDTTDLKGKKVIPFITHGSGGLSNTIKDLQKMAVGASVQEPVLGIRDEDVPKSETDIYTWLRKHGY